MVNTLIAAKQSALICPIWTKRSGAGAIPIGGAGFDQGSPDAVLITGIKSTVNSDGSFLLQSVSVYDCGRDISFVMANGGTAGGPRVNCYGGRIRASNVKWGWPNGSFSQTDFMLGGSTLPKYGPIIGSVPMLVGMSGVCDIRASAYAYRDGILIAGNFVTAQQGAYNNMFDIVGTNVGSSKIGYVVNNISRSEIRWDYVLNGNNGLSFPSRYGNYAVFPYTGVTPYSFLVMPDPALSILSRSPNFLIQPDDSTYFASHYSSSVTPWGAFLRGSAQMTTKMAIYSLDGSKYWPITFVGMDSAATTACASSSGYDVKFDANGTAWMVNTQLGTYLGNSIPSGGKAGPNWQQGFTLAASSFLPVTFPSFGLPCLPECYCENPPISVR